MTTPKITGNEPYYPSPISAQDRANGHSSFPGITIKQKFIADWLIQNEATWKRENGNLQAAAQNRFELYLNIINGE